MKRLRAPGTNAPSSMASGQRELAGRLKDRPAYTGRSPEPRNTGLTLVEVLMSMMVMGIGVLSVITMLPLAFVRSIQATNLTNATILRFNAEAVLNVDPLDYVYIYPFWAANTTYAVGQNIVVPGSVSGNNHYFQCTTAGISGGAAPTWVLGGVTPDGTAQWTDQGALSAYVVDPLGWNSIAVTSPGLQGGLGNNQLVAGTVGAAPPGTTIERFNGGINASVDGGAATSGDANSVLVAANDVKLPDSWVEQARGAVTGFTVNTVTVNNANLNGVSVSTPANLPPIALSRVVMFDATNKNSETRLLTGVAGATATWSANDPLLGTFSPVQARVEMQDRRYTWLLTVLRNTSGVTNVYVTAFFNRPLVANDEQVYSVTGTDGVGTPFTISYGGMPKPFVKKGGFLFDVSFGRWYRVTDIVSDNGSTTMQVLVNQSRVQSEALQSATFGAVFMRGVVDVFPIGTK